MPAWLIPAIMAGSSLIGGLLAGKKSARQQTAIEPTEYQPLRDLLISTAMNRLKTPSTLMPGFEATGIRNINENVGLMRQSLENRLGGAGLLGSGVHGAGLTSLEMGRFRDINDLQNIGLPRLERDFANQDVDLATRIFSQRVPGTQLPSSAAGAGMLTASGMLALLYGMGAFGSGKGSSSPQSSLSPRG